MNVGSSHLHQEVASLAGFQAWFSVFLSSEVSVSPEKMKYGPLNPPSWGQFLQLFANKVLKNNLRGDFLDKRGK